MQPGYPWRNTVWQKRAANCTYWYQYKQTNTFACYVYFVHDLFIKKINKFVTLVMSCIVKHLVRVACCKLKSRQTVKIIKIRKWSWVCNSISNDNIHHTRSYRTLLSIIIIYCSIFNFKCVEMSANERGKIYFYSNINALFSMQSFKLQVMIW